ncbi:unnamed protein product [Aphanomyces euteiches]|uniref:Protein kinase domain-containing protein n=1 Tax=Aphanomyces euteiches TaxID=100861 RepID=A0A6G0X4G4_9STRA|nr:hypothetical protein Ae201684_008623 [Aphanomyces euteiches]KAH9085430.1 hypothetical protein Ae201684P_005138 [Aphanomyces euteiches]KAH9139959.1 hypothetical protein AeRB84_015784 [Aphanomyces euteiches]
MDISKTPITFLESLPANVSIIAFRENGITRLGDLSVDKLKRPLTTASLSLVGQAFTSLDSVTLPPALQSLSLANSVVRSIRNTTFPATLTALNLTNVSLDAFIVDQSSFLILSRLPSFGSNYTIRASSCLGTLQSIQNGAYSICVTSSSNTVPQSTSMSPPSLNSTTISTGESPSESSSSLATTVALSCVLAVVAGVIIYFVVGRCRHRLRYSGVLKTRRSIALLSSPKATMRGSLMGLHDVRFDPVIASSRLARSDVRSVRTLQADGRATVHYGYWKKEPVTIRQLQPNNPRISVELFMDEVRTCVQVHHPHIVTCLGVTWSTSTDMAIVSEYLDGGSLKSHMTQNGHTKEFHATKWRIASQITEALAYLHGIGICYRSLHADTVLFTSDGVVKLANYGLNKLSVRGGQSGMVSPLLSHLTSIAPELLNGEDFSTMSDIYALGIVLCELDSGRAMAASFDMKGDDTLRDDVEKIMMGQFNPEVSTSCPDEITQIIHACVHEDPHERPTIQAVLQVLQTYGGGLDV